MSIRKCIWHSRLAQLKRERSQRSIARIGTLEARRVSPEVVGPLALAVRKDQNITCLDEVLYVEPEFICWIGGAGLGAGRI